MRTAGLALLALAGGCGAPCTTLAEGAWTLDGAHVGMAMGVTVTMDVEACTFTFGDWSMTMYDLPTGGSVDGSDVTMAGSTWDDCIGTVNDAGNAASGTCGNGDDWSMTAGAPGTE